MTILSVGSLTKLYPAFTLDRVSFSLESGSIMGFIGRNGAGKTTTLKSMLGLVHPDGGSVAMFGTDFFTHQAECRQRLGVVFGEANYYPTKRLRDIASVTKRFYGSWDDSAYRKYMTRFALDETKKIAELSSGMRVKFALALALSHDAKLFLLDEPTSGLDPVSRDELIGIFRELVSDGERSILFSTHIISDLEKCADSITYIHAGRILASEDITVFQDGYRAVSGADGELTPERRSKMIGLREHKFGWEGMIRTEDQRRFDGMDISRIGLEEIMVHMEREEQK